jgi:hypothetical protein
MESIANDPPTFADFNSDLAIVAGAELGQKRIVEFGREQSSAFALLLDRIHLHARQLANVRHYHVSFLTESRRGSEW